VLTVSPASDRIRGSGVDPADRVAGNDVAVEVVDFHYKIQGFARWANTNFKGRKNL
jgi:hypothetical protein